MVIKIFWIKIIALVTAYQLSDVIVSAIKAVKIKWIGDINKYVQDHNFT